MYTTNFDKIECILKGYAIILERYSENLIIPLSRKFQVTQSGSNFLLMKTPESLHNLYNAPAKAIEIIKHITTILIKDFRNNYASLQKKLLSTAIESMNSIYTEDCSALIFIKEVFENIENILADESQFTPFDYF